jgi:hypothetical protein
METGAPIPRLGQAGTHPCVRLGSRDESGGPSRGSNADHSGCGGTLSISLIDQSLTSESRTAKACVFFSSARSIAEGEYPKFRPVFVHVVWRSVVIPLVGILIEMYLNDDFRIRRASEQMERDFSYVHCREACLRPLNVKKPDCFERLAAERTPCNTVSCHGPCSAAKRVSWNQKLINRRRAYPGEPSSVSEISFGGKTSFVNPKEHDEKSAQIQATTKEVSRNFRGTRYASVPYAAGAVDRNQSHIPRVPSADHVNQTWHPFLAFSGSPLGTE